jgi:hypothetical protein
MNAWSRPVFGSTARGAKSSKLANAEFDYRTRAIAQHVPNHSSLSDGFIGKKSVAIHPVSFAFRTTTTCAVEAADFPAVHGRSLAGF